MAGIKYVSQAETELCIRRYNFETRLARIVKKFNQQKKPTVGDEVIALMKKYRHLTDT